MSVVSCLLYKIISNTFFDYRQHTTDNLSQTTYHRQHTTNNVLVTSPRHVPHSRYFVIKPRTFSNSSRDFAFKAFLRRTFNTEKNLSCGLVIFPMERPSALFYSSYLHEIWGSCNRHFSQHSFYLPRIARICTPARGGHVSVFSGPGNPRR
jgi:hypothetical protein